MPKKTSVTLKRPASRWTTPLRIKPVPLVASILKGIVDVATLNISDATTDLEELIGAIGLEIGADGLAWRLVVRALSRALSDLLRESQHSFDDKQLEAATDAFRVALLDALDKSQPTLDATFFAQPGALALLPIIQPLLASWLSALGFASHDAINLSARLPVYFTYAVHDEWLARSSEYQPLEDTLRTPFTSAAERSHAWDRYASRLQRQINEPMLGETFGIVHVYVPLCAYYEESVAVTNANKTPRDATEQSDGITLRRHVVLLERELKKWLDQRSRKDAIRVISGGPGSGKSSSAKVLAATWSQGGRRVLFVPLHLIDPRKDLETAVSDFARQQGIVNDNPLQTGTDSHPLVLILDGLDELAMQGRAAAEVAHDFLAEIVRYTTNVNQSESAPVQVLLTSREVVIQSVRSDFRGPGQILHLLPYAPSYHESSRLFDPERLMQEDRRDKWWSAYGAVTGRTFSRMPDPLRRSDLDEITSQPLLSFLVAMSYARGAIDFRGEVDRNIIYADMISAVHERTYAGGRHPSVRHLSLEHFGELLEEVALATWHGDGRTTTVGAIYFCCQRSGLDVFLESFEDGARSGATRLLTAFYFRQSEGRRDGEKTFEFTHKSFREYLTARRLVRGLNRIKEELDTRVRVPGRGWGVADAALHWAELAGPTEIDEYILQFVRDELRRSGVEHASQLQTALCRTATIALQGGLPMERIDPRPSYGEEARQARNAEEAALLVVSLCAAVSNHVSPFNWSSEGGAAAWIRRLVERRSGQGPALVLQALSGLDLHGQDMRRSDLYGADMTRANCDGVNFESAILIGADMRDARFRRAVFKDADLREANLENADLQDADLSGADLGDANMRNAIVEGARFDRACVSGRQFHGAIGTPVAGQPMLDFGRAVTRRPDRGHIEHDDDDRP
jgi:hypothetical protein